MWLLLWVTSSAVAQIGDTWDDDDDDDWFPTPSSPPPPPPPPPPPWVVVLLLVVAAATLYIRNYRDTRKYTALSDKLVTGAWAGYYTEHHHQHDMQLHLSVDKGDETTVLGGGEDDLGKFTIAGRLSDCRRTIQFVKTYTTPVGWRMTAHSVAYEGHMASDNRLAGTWTINAARGSFELCRQ